MPVISVTRLRVRRWWFVPQFVLSSLRAARQAAAADGNLRVALLRDRKQVYWTCTSWASEAAINTFMHAAPHGPLMRRLLNWCDEASLVHWTQDGGELPAWPDAHGRLQREGRRSKVNWPSADHQAFRITPPAPNAVSTKIK